MTQTPSLRNVFRDSADYPFVRVLEARFEAMLSELEALGPEEFALSPDALTVVAPGYDERGWRYVDLVGGAATDEMRARCPKTLAACACVPGLVNAGFSVLRPGTHLSPHRGELQGVLRCHLGLAVPAGDAALRGGGETRRWEPGRCLVFDDTVEHEAWNRGERDRAVLLVTFAAD